ncbi:hypothetical protein PR048_019936, partial [Dryococelus australis]
MDCAGLCNDKVDERCCSKTAARTPSRLGLPRLGPLWADARGACATSATRAVPRGQKYVMLDPALKTLSLWKNIRDWSTAFDWQVIALHSRFARKCASRSPAQYVASTRRRPLHVPQMLHVITSKWIRIGEPVEWTACSIHLNPLDFFVRGSPRHWCMTHPSCRRAISLPGLRLSVTRLKKH